MRADESVIDFRRAQESEDKYLERLFISMKGEYGDARDIVKKLKKGNYDEETISEAQKVPEYLKGTMLMMQRRVWSACKKSGRRGQLRQGPNQGDHCTIWSG